MRNRKKIELFYRLKLEKIVWLGLRNDYGTLISLEKPEKADLEPEKQTDSEGTKND